MSIVFIILHRRAISSALLLAAMGVVAAGSAQASGISDANAGMTALTSGQYQSAIRFFTHALNTKGFSPANRELAYVKRGEAELGLTLIGPSLKDFRRALQLKPDDDEAQQFLRLAESAQPQTVATSSPRAAAAERVQRLQAAWGSMSRLAGHTYLEIDGKPVMYFQYQWERPWEVLTFTGMDRSGNPIAGRYQLDEATSQISGVAIFKGQVGQSVVQATSDSFVEDGQSAESKTRQTFQVSGPAAFQLTNVWFKGGKWRTGKSLPFVEVTQDAIAALGWTTAPPTPGFWSNLFANLKGGALEGFHDGLRDGIHDATQCRVAGKATQAPGCTTQ